MSSRNLYPPIVDSYMPAFVANQGAECQIIFSLSKFNSDSSKIKNVHISITDQITGRNVLDTEKYPSAIILNGQIKRVNDENNLFYTKILDTDLKDGWKVDRFYKIQLRLSEIEENDGSISESAWLKNNADKFSEWSTVCIVKSINKIDYAIPMLNIDTREIFNDNNTIIEHTIYKSTFVIVGSFFRADNSTELIHSYNFILYDEDNNIIEDSGTIYTNKYNNSDSFNYTFKTELENNKEYYLAFQYITTNGYKDGFYYFDKETDKRYRFICSLYNLDKAPCRIITIENDARKNADSPWIMAEQEDTSLHKEEDEGRVALKFFAETEQNFSGNLCVRRADSRDNFKTWTDIYLYIARIDDIDAIPIFYDYTIESGIWYKYGVQKISYNGERGTLDIAANPVMRNFNYSFLLGKDNQQLKLQFDNTMPNFKHQIYDSKVDPIGSTYTHIARNANTNYKTFPINGLISFYMDENGLFDTKKNIYKYDAVNTLYNNYNESNNIIQYDYIYEREFRKRVLSFLQDGELKLFKSPTEGNVIVRLTDVNCVPNQTTDRLIYSFSATASEMDAATMSNYLKYGFYYVKPYATDFATYETKIGQIIVSVPKNNINVFDLIKEKYGDGQQDIGGYTNRVANIHHMKLSFDGPPLRIENKSHDLVLGNKFKINDTDIVVLNPAREYEFDSKLSYTLNDTMYIYGDAEDKVSTIDITLDFLYELEREEYIPKRIQSREISQGIGQIYTNCAPDTNLFAEIYYKYYRNADDEFTTLTYLSSAIIEANPGAAFSIKDISDGKEEIHIVGITGILELSEIEYINTIKYLGMQNLLSDGSKNIERINTDVSLTYIYVLTKGSYQDTGGNRDGGL